MGQALYQAGHKVEDVFGGQSEFARDFAGGIALLRKREDTALIAAKSSRMRSLDAQDTLLLAMADAGFINLKPSPIVFLSPSATRRKRREFRSELRTRPAANWLCS